MKGKSRTRVVLTGIALLLIALPLLGACTKEVVKEVPVEKVVEKTVTPTPPPSPDSTAFQTQGLTQEAELLKIDTPIWDSNDLELIKMSRENPDVQVTVQERNYHSRPPFYDGPMPLKVELIIKPRGAILDPVTLKWSYDGFETYFIYLDPGFKASGIPEGAVTIDKTGLIAEARFIGLVKDENGQFQGIEIEEFHYGLDEKLVFYCKSQIDQGGSKIEQIEEFGNKARDYYFIWPMGY